MYNFDISDDSARRTLGDGKDWNFADPVDPPKQFVPLYTGVYNLGSYSVILSIFLILVFMSIKRSLTVQ